MPLHDSRQRSALKIPANIAAISALTLALAACQTTPLTSSSPFASNPANDSKNAALAKKTIADTWQKQRTRTYAYETSIEVSNQNYQAALAKATPQQLAMAETAENHCEYVHDQAYVALMSQAEAQGLAADDEAFTPQRDALKTSYLDCDQEYRAWEKARGDGATEAAWYDDEEDSQVDDTAEAVAVAATETVDVANEENEEDAATEESETEFLPGYDNTHTRLSVKKAKLLEAYLLKPITISAQGVYKPFAGAITALPTFQYQTRNHVSAVNQPIYIDARNGDIYFWADNFALAISESLDDKLGTTWQNKWLKLSLNDGSLPAGFGRDLIKSHFTALDAALESAPLQEFKFVSPAQLKTLTPPLAPNHLPIMLTAQAIASQEQTESASEAASNLYLRHLYDQLTQKYPELIEEDAADAEVTNDLDDASEAGLETNVESSFEANLETGADEAESSAAMFTSKAIVKQVLSLIKTHLDEAATTQDTQAEKQVAAAQDAKKALDNAAPTKIQYAKVSANPAQTPLTAVQSLYGYNGNGQLLWKMQRAQMPKQNSLGVETGEGLTIDALTHYKALSSMPIAYPNLPTAAQVPTASNSVDIKAYSKSLSEYYDSGEGTEIGKTIFGMLSMYKTMARAQMQGGSNDYEDSDYENSDADAEAAEAVDAVGDDLEYE